MINLRIDFSLAIHGPRGCCRETLHAKAQAHATMLGIDGAPHLIRINRSDARSGGARDRSVDGRTLHLPDSCAPSFPFSGVACCYRGPVEEADAVPCVP